MTNTISFVGANYVARELGYTLSGDAGAYWERADSATQAAFRPLETFEGKFGALLQDIKALGFGALDLWLGHLHPSWASRDHIEIASGLLGDTGITLTSLAGGFGETRAQFEASCKLAADLGAPLLGGPTSFHQTDRTTTVALLSDYGVKLGLENHPERTAAEMLELIGNGEGVIGTAVDTGWYGTQGYDAAQALRELSEHIYQVHLKDVTEVGSHVTCRFGEGVVPTEACVATLRTIGYKGAISIEHEPPDYNPEADIRADLALLKGWLANG